MKRLLITISVFVILMCMNVYAEEETSADGIQEETQTTEQESLSPAGSSGKNYVFSDNQDNDINEILNDPDASVENLLRVIIVLLKDLDIYIQFFVTLVFAIGLTYFVILKPIRYFLI